MNTDMKSSAECTETVHDEFKDVFTGVGYFKGTFSLHVKEEAKLTMHPRNVVWHLH